MGVAGGMAGRIKLGLFITFQSMQVFSGLVFAKFSSVHRAEERAQGLPQAHNTHAHFKHYRCASLPRPFSLMHMHAWSQVFCTDLRRRARADTPSSDGTPSGHLHSKRTSVYLC